ncbi:Cilia- and flagella-associated protein 58 [Chlorella vulgaris]
MAEDADPKKDLPGGEGKQYDTIEHDFQEVMRELAGDAALDRFRAEYEKVFRALKKSHDNEKRLIKKCRELNSEIVSGAAKVQAALKLSDEDQATITALKKEIENSWRMVDSSHEKELKAKEQVAAFKLEISGLTKLLEQGAAVGLAEEADLEELIRQKEEAAAERDMQVEQIVGLRNDVAAFSDRLRTAEVEKASLEAEIQALRDQSAQRRAEADREIKRRERLEREMKELRLTLEARQQDIRDKQLVVQQSGEYVEKLKLQLRDSQLAGERLQKEYNALAERAGRLHHSLQEHIHSNTQLLADNSQRQVEIKAKEDEIRLLREEGVKATRAREQMAAKLVQLEKQRGDAEVAALERELENARKHVNIERRKQQDMLKERERLHKARTSAETNTAKHVDLVKVADGMKRNLQQEMAGYSAELAKQEQVIRALEREKNRFASEAAAVNEKYAAAVEEVALRDSAILDLQRKIAEDEVRLRRQQELYEAVRSERNTYSRNVVEVQDEIAELRRRLGISSHQIDLLKQEVAARDHTLQKEKYDHEKAEKDCEALRAEINRVAAAAAEQEAAMNSQRAEVRQLQNVIAEADQARLRLKKDYDLVVGERDALGSQLVRRNEELRLLYEKIKIQHSVLYRGQAQYRDRLNEIRVLKMKVSGLQRELVALKSSVTNAEVLRREVHHLNRELLAERSKVKALGEELESPLNVHRWRKLEGSDPSAYELVLKVQALQRRLMLKTEEVVEKDILIQEKEKLYLELKAILARQPGPEAAEQLSLLREKTKQMKSLASELDMYQAQVQDYKYDIERLQREMAEVKRRYFEQKRSGGGICTAPCSGATENHQQQQQQQQQQQGRLGLAASAVRAGDDKLAPVVCAASAQSSPAMLAGVPPLKASPAAVNVISVSVMAVIGVPSLASADDAAQNVSMQAPGAPQAAMSSGKVTEPLGDQLFLPQSIRGNFDVMNFNKIFASLLAGCFAGIAGITGYKGFVIYLIAHAIMAGLLLLKAAPQPTRYFPATTTLAFSGILSQTEMLTFILFWTLSGNIKLRLPPPFPMLKALLSRRLAQAGSTAAAAVTSRAGVGGGWLALHSSAAAAASLQVKIPALGESISDGTVSAVLKQAGDRVEEDEAILQIETDKVTVDVRAPQAGFIEAILVKEDDNVEVGHVVASISDSAKGTASKPAPAAKSAEASAAPPAEAKKESKQQSGSSSEAPAAAAAAPAPAAPAAAAATEAAERAHRAPSIAFPPRRTPDGKPISMLPASDAKQMLASMLAAAGGGSSSSAGPSAAAPIPEQYRNMIAVPIVGGSMPILRGPPVPSRGPPGPARQVISDREMEAIMLGGAEP